MIINPVDIPNDGRVFIASDVIDIGDAYRYEYAIYNLTSDYNINGLEIPVPSNAIVSNIGFSDVDSHSGEPFATNAWNSSTTVTPSSGTPPSNSDENANAIRWAPCTTSTSSAMGARARQRELEVFRTNGTVTAGHRRPLRPVEPVRPQRRRMRRRWRHRHLRDPVPSAGGFADFNQDGIVNSADLGGLIAAWGCG